MFLGRAVNSFDLMDTGSQSIALEVLKIGNNIVTVSFPPNLKVATEENARFAGRRELADPLV